MSPLPSRVLLPTRSASSVTLFTNQMPEITTLLTKTIMMRYMFLIKGDIATVTALPPRGGPARLFMRGESQP